MFSVESFGTRRINASLNRYFSLFCCGVVKFVKFSQGKRTFIVKLKNKYENDVLVVYRLFSEINCKRKAFYLSWNI